MSLIARVVCVRHDINNAVLESVRNCALLFFPKSQKQELLTDDIESVSLYSGTRDVFRELMLGDSVATIGIGAVFSLEIYIQMVQTIGLLWWLCLHRGQAWAGKVE